MCKKVYKKEREIPLFYFSLNKLLTENQYASFSENSDVAKMENNDA
jgi:hypothetical protein